MLRAVVTTLLAAIACALVGCVHPDPIPSSASSPPPEAGSAEAKVFVQERDEVAFYDMTEAYGLKVSIDLVTGRRVCVDGTNEVIVMPSSSHITINRKDYPLEGMIRWQDGVLYLPGDCRSILAEALDSVPVPEVAHDPEYFDGSEPTLSWRSRPTRRTKNRPRRTKPLPAAWRVKSKRPWHSIVIHHSATEQGGAASFHRSHKKKWKNGLGYHFVIGNGTSTPDGKIEVGPRWLQQAKGVDGAHAGAKRYNKFGIGICLVGDFSSSRPTPRQLVALRRLCRALMSRYGISRKRIYPHKAVRQGSTSCPGTNFPFSAFLRSL